MPKAKTTTKSARQLPKEAEPTSYDATPYNATSFDGEFHPVYLSSRRESILIIMIFLVFASFSLTVSLLMGWNTAGLQPGADASTVPETVSSYVFGMPPWVFYGVFVPWVCACFVTIGFAFLVIEDGSLEDGPINNDVEQNQ